MQSTGLVCVQINHTKAVPLSSQLRENFIDSEVVNDAPDCNDLTMAPNKCVHRLDTGFVPTSNRAADYIIVTRSSIAHLLRIRKSERWLWAES